MERGTRIGSSKDHRRVAQCLSKRRLQRESGGSGGHGRHWRNLPYVPFAAEIQRVDRCEEQRNRCERDPLGRRRLTKLRITDGLAHCTPTSRRRNRLSFRIWGYRESVCLPIDVGLSGLPTQTDDWPAGSLLTAFKTGNCIAVYPFVMQWMPLVLQWMPLVYTSYLFV